MAWTVGAVVGADMSRSRTSAGRLPHEAPQLGRPTGPASAAAAGPGRASARGGGRVLRDPGERQEHVLRRALLRDARAHQPGPAAHAPPDDPPARALPGDTTAVRGRPGQHDPG